MTEDKKCETGCSTEKSCGMLCPITGCPVKHVLISTLIVFAVTMAFDMLYHGVFLKDAYTATSALWRLEAEMQAMFFPYCILYHFVLALGVSGLYCMVAKNSCCGGKCPKSGMKFGVMLGLIVGIGMFSNYMWIPMPLDLAVKWLVGGLVWGVLIGAVLAYTRRWYCKG